MPDVQTPETARSRPHQTLVQAVPACRRVLSFGAMNAINFQIALGPPLILLARHWGASSTYIGLVTALVPLLTLVQIYMAPRVEYIGFRRVMLMGWTGRNLMIGLIAALPILARFGWLDPFTLRAALFSLMFGFNFLRGLATASWLPWLGWLVPLRWRGRYLAAEQLTVNLASAVAIIFSGWILGGHPTELRFSFIFFISFVAGWTSIYIMREIPAPSPKPGQPEPEPVLKWLPALWRERPFRRLVRVNLLFWFAIYAWHPFTVLFLRDEVHVSQDRILYLSAINTLGAVLSSLAWGRLADRHGSRPVMAVSTRVLFVGLVCWVMMALGLMPRTLPVIVSLFLMMGIGGVGFVVANARYQLNNTPRDRPILALTAFTVIVNLANGAAPIVWGMMIDLVKRFEVDVAGLQFSRFAIFYGGTLLLLYGCKKEIRRLPDQEAAESHVVLYHLLLDYPLRPINLIYNMLFARR